MYSVSVDHNWKYDKSAMMPVPNDDALSGAMYDVWKCENCRAFVTVMDQTSDWGFLDGPHGKWVPYVGPKNAPPPLDHVVNGMRCGDEFILEIMDL